MSKQPVLRQGLFIKWCDASRLERTFRLCDHLLDETATWSPSERARHEDNESVRVMPSNNGHPGTPGGLRAFFDETRSALIGTLVKRQLLQIVVSPAPGNPFTFSDDQIRYVNARIHAALGTNDQPSVCVIHERDRQGPKPEDTPIHWHIIIGNVTSEGRSKYAQISYPKLALYKLRQDLEQEFGLTISTPGQTTDTATDRADARTGQKRADEAAELQELWNAPTSGRTFIASAVKLGYIFEQGDRTPVVARKGEKGTRRALKGLLGKSVTIADVKSRLPSTLISSFPNAPPSPRKMSPQKAARVARAKEKAATRSPTRFVVEGAGAKAGFPKLADPSAPNTPAAPPKATMPNPSAVGTASDAPNVTKSRLKPKLTSVQKVNVEAIRQSYAARISAARDDDEANELQKQCEGDIERALRAEDGAQIDNAKAVEQADVENKELDRKALDDSVQKAKQNPVARPVPPSPNKPGQ